MQVKQLLSLRGKDAATSERRPGRYGAVGATALGSELDIRYAQAGDQDMADHVMRLDARDLICPIPVLKARKALKALPPGAVLEVLATDPAAPKDFAAFCDATGNVLLSTGSVDGAALFRIEKAG